MTALIDIATSEGPDGIVVRFIGRLTLARLGDLPERLAALDSIGELDLSQIERIDTVGAWLIVRTAQRHNAAIRGANQTVHRLLDAVTPDPADLGIAKPHGRVSYRLSIMQLLAEIGESTTIAFQELLGILGFFGATILSFFAMLVHHRALRWHAIITRFRTVGVNALAIIGLMSFLIGIVLAQQSAIQLQQFGLEIYTINLVGRASIRELGLLMTAIMIAGRSGSAFAAQIGTMKLTEEIDAMRTIGISPMEAIVIPRVMASTIMMPMLGFYASIAAILGGGIFCWTGLDIPPLTFVQRLHEIIPMTDFWIMLIKAPIFGMLVGVTGCYEGMQVQKNAEEVGRRTTAAVVSAIFLVIVLDALFAVFFSSLGWN